MELIRGLHNLRAMHHGCVATIGNFDGVHLGHQHVLKQLQADAHRTKMPSVAIVFEPQPQEFFNAAQAPARLSSWRQKFELICGSGIDRMMCLRFDQKLARLEAEDFVNRLLIEGLGVEHLVVGDDFSFGRGRLGNFDLLNQMGSEHGFEVMRAQTRSQSGERISSTRVRGLLEQGDFDAVVQLLGRPYQMEGRVAYGHGQGRKLGFPTANIHLNQRYQPSLNGIYAARIHGLQAQTMDAVVYVGNRPVLNDSRPVLEIHIFDYDDNCYGQHLAVEFKQKIRDDRHFDSLELMTEQINCDVKQAREILADNTN